MIRARAVGNRRPSPVRSPWLVHVIFTRTSPPVITHKKRLIVEAVFFNMSVGNSKSACGHKMVLQGIRIALTCRSCKHRAQGSGPGLNRTGLESLSRRAKRANTLVRGPKCGSTSSYRYNFPTNQNRPSLHPPFD